MSYGHLLKFIPCDLWFPSILPSTPSFSFTQVSIGSLCLVFRQFEKSTSGYTLDTYASLVPYKFLFLGVEYIELSIVCTYASLACWITPWWLYKFWGYRFILHWNTAFWGRLDEIEGWQEEGSPDRHITGSGYTRDTCRGIFACTSVSHVRGLSMYTIEKFLSIACTL